MSRQVTPPQSQNRSVAIGSTDTSMSKKQSGFEPYSSTPPSNGDQRFQNMALEISRYVVGPMPVSEFLNKFLRPETAPNEQKSKRLVPNDTIKGIQTYLASKSGEEYQALCFYWLTDPQVNALQPVCSNFEFRDTHMKKDKTFQDYTIGPDVCVFNQGSDDVDVTQAEIMMELKPDKNKDPFADESEVSFVKETITGNQTLGQTTVYATAHQASQFRTHSFSVLVFPKYARLLRWDRSGVTVTGAIPINSPEFIEFFQLFDEATPQKRGIDTSVSTPSPENASKARISLGIDSNIPLVQFSLDFSSDKAYSASGDTNGVYIVSRNAYMNKSHSPLGRSTRTFIAYSTSDQFNVFLKDSWRIDSQTPEHEIYATLRAKDVPHLPTVLAGSDIFDQTTITQDVLEENPIWIKAQPKPLRKHRHYRLILKEIATPLHLFSSTKILVAAIYDAIKAHSAAFKAGILHRDISSGNIMIYDNGGLLIDWDLSKSTKDQNARESERTGATQKSVYTLAAENQPDYEQCHSAFDDDRFDDMWLEVLKYVVGPMPVDGFLQRFLRSLTPNSTPLPPISHGDLVFEKKPSGESGPYTKFINAVQPIFSNLELRDVYSSPMYTFESLEIQPDLCVFNRGISDIDLCDPSKPEIMLKVSTESDDPFDDNGEYVTLGEDDTSKAETYFVKETRAGRRTLGQITAYAAAQQAAQFRTHIFSVLVFPKHARLFRWDRSGVVVTERFPLCSRYFLEFFHLYNHATRHVRGLDISASIPSEDDTSKARVALGGESRLPLVQLSVGSSSYIISRKVYMNHDCPFGRSTRGFVAYSVPLNETVFLKDSWRLDYQTPEHDVYRRLRSSHVPHIPNVIEGGDILDHKTFTQDLLEEDLVWIRDPPRRLKRHRHYRLILKEIATPLHSFPSTKILVSAIYDAVKAHRAAYFDAGILHRDISPGNIMIYNNGGLLIDWDLSKSTSDDCGQGSERTGTWQFIACRLLKDPTAAQGFTDDVESFIHVITWVSFRYAKHNLPYEAVLAFLTSVFNHAWTGKDGFTKGGRTKMNYLTSPSQLMETEFQNPILKELLLNITEKIAVRYTRAPPFTDAEVVNFLTNAEGLEKLDSAALISKLASIRQTNHEDKLRMLEDSEWIINEFASVLGSSGWPANDEAKKYEKIKSAQSTIHTGGKSFSLKRKGFGDAGGESKKPRALASK
ncbi:hypothetical protein Clacol_003395 [Clathrus columnatus]|uniref:Protein kinase domain-containing protein n=1 Tax=Clathrus columnatus TaxID=1419009 RepID=A0AAV5A7I4_9AGAM|nr:hypothetical protein Clacol_003395 [Clathrus columnatus]